MNNVVVLMARWRYVVLVVVPACMAWLYLGIWASAGYVSHASLVVEQDSGLSSLGGAELALGFLGGGTGRSKQDALLVANFMHSRAMLEYLEGELHIKAHYSSHDVDWIGRMGTDWSDEKVLEYVQDHIKVAIDDESLIISVEVVAFAPDFAQTMAAKLIARSELFVNEVSRNLARGQMLAAQEQVDVSQDRFRKASRDMIAKQRQNDVFSPEQEGEALGQIIIGLEVELAKQRTKLKTLSEFLNPSAPDVVAAKQQIRALESQLGQERGRLVGNKQTGLNDLMLDFQDAEVDVKLATEVYKSALASLEKARVDAVKKAKYLIAVDPPSLPDAAELPRVGYWLVTIFVMLNLLYFVGTLAVATIQDHRE